MQIIGSSIGIVTCTFTNTRNTGSVLVHKKVDSDGDGTFEGSDTAANTLGFRWGLDGVSPARNMGSTATGIETGSHDVNENSITDYHLVGWFEGEGSCSDVTSTLPATVAVNKNATTTVTICNSRDTGTIELTKVWSGTGGQTTLGIGTTAGASDVDSQLTGASGASPLTTGQNTVITGTYFNSETGGLTDYTPSPLSCFNDADNSGDNNGEASITVGANDSVTIATGQHVICTYTNTRNTGTIELKKHWVGAAGDTNLKIGSTNGGTEIANKPVSGSDDTTTQKTVDTGTYYANEDAITGYDSAPLSCFNDANNNGTNDSEPTVTVGANNSVSVVKGQHVICTFTNTQRGHIIVDKVTDPSGDPQSFYFPTDGTGYNPFDLTDQATPNDQELKPGTYIVGENLVDGWDLTHKECVYDNQSVGVSITNGEQVTLDPGDTVRCTFTNTKRGSITIVKDAQPNDLIDFSFSGTLGAFSLDDDAGVVGGDNTLQNNKTFSNKVPGNYTVTETLPNSFWTFGGVSCVLTGTTTPYTNTSNTTNGVVITLNPGADVTCTFVNTKQSPTRTLGFWQTHTAYTSSIFAAAPISSSMPIGTAPHKEFITTTGQLFGAFYSSIPKTTTGTNRSVLDKARMQLLQQLVAAKLNCAAFGCVASVQTLISNADSHYASGTAAQILADVNLLDAYNNSGDTAVIGNAGKATPKDSQSLADKVFWNSP